jgi:flagellin
MVQTAEGALNEVHDMLQRMNELCVKAANDTLTYDDRSYIQQEIWDITDEIDRVGTSTTFNEIELFNGLQQGVPTSVVPGGTINGSQGTITQGTNKRDAYYTTNNVQLGDIAFVPAHGEEPDTYLKASTVDEIEAYKREWREYDEALAIYERKKQIYDQNPTAPGAEEPEMPQEPLKRDGSSEDKAKLVEKVDVLHEIALDLARNNLGANLDVADSISVRYGEGQNSTRFNLHYYGPLNVTLQVGAESDHTYTFEIDPVNASSLGILEINVKGTDGTGARAGIDMVKKAIEKNSEDRANLGAIQNRLDHIIRNLDNVVENTTAAESRIRDTDMASEMQQYSNADIIAQAGQTILAQANQSNQGVLGLLQ